MVCNNRFVGNLILPNEEENFSAVEKLLGNEELKSEVRLLMKFKQNQKDGGALRAVLPNYIFAGRRGAGMTTCVEAFSNDLASNEILKFRGIKRFFEHKLAYCPPNTNNNFYELRIFKNAINKYAGTTASYHGIAAVDVTDWTEYVAEENFRTFLAYLAKIRERVLTILCVHSDDELAIRKMEHALSLANIIFRRINIDLPDTAEAYMRFMEEKYFRPHGFTILDDAKVVLKQSIDAHIASKQLNGFKAMERFAKDMLFAWGSSDNHSLEVNAQMVKNFDKESPYMQRLLLSSVNNNAIGFGLRKEPHYDRER